MRLYLSSYKLGNHSDKLLELVGAGRRVAIIENAVDYIPKAERIAFQKNVYDIHAVFQALGFSPEGFDLRNYFRSSSRLRSDLSKYDLIWVYGGNVFLLRRAMAQSGFDKVLPVLLEDDIITYGGFSAGACILSPSLKGFEFCDDPFESVDGYNKDIIWSGLGILDHAIAPHYRSNHPETGLIEKTVEYYRKNNVAHVTLRDGDVYLMKGEEKMLLPYEEGKPYRFDKSKSSGHLYP